MSYPTGRRLKFKYHGALLWLVLYCYGNSRKPNFHVTLFDFYRTVTESILTILDFLWVFTEIFSCLSLELMDYCTGTLIADNWLNTFTCMDFYWTFITWFMLLLCVEFFLRTVFFLLLWDNTWVACFLVTWYNLPFWPWHSAIDICRAHTWGMSFIS